MSDWSLSVRVRSNNPDHHLFNNHITGGVTFGRLLEVYGRNASESTCTPVLALEPEPFVTVSFEMVGGTTLRKEAN